MIITLRTLALVALSFVAATTSAFAHAHLKASTPASGSTVATPPTDLNLTFSEGLNLKFTGVKITGSDKSAVPTGDARLGANDDTTLIVPVTGTLAAGTYKVNWHALSSDGHKTSGSYSFTVKP